MKTALLSLGLFFVFIFTCLAFTPMVLSSPWGQKKFLSWINKKLPGALSIDSMSLNWTSPQTVNEISLVDEKEVPIFHCEAIAIDASLWSIIFRQNLGVMTLTTPQVHLRPSFEPSETSSSKLSKLPLLLTGKIALDNGSLSIEGEGIDPVVFRAITLGLEVNRQRTNALLNLKGISEQNDIGGQFALKAAVQPQTLTVDLEASLQNFPVKGIDQILSLVSKEYEGLLLSSVGPSINLNLQAKNSKEVFEVSLNAASQFLNAYVQTQSQNNVVTLKSPAKMTFTLTPTLGALLGIPLAAPANGKITVEQFRLPEMEFPEASLQGSLTIIGIPDLQNILLRVSSSGLKKGIAFDFSGQSAQGPVAVSGDILGAFTPALKFQAVAGIENKLKLTVEELVFPKPFSLETMELKAQLQAEALSIFKNVFCTIEAQTWNNIGIQLHSDTLSTGFLCSLKKDPLSLVIKTPLAFDYLLTQDLLKTYVPQLALVKPAPFKIQLEPLTLPLEDLQLGRMKLKGKALANELYLSSADKKRQAELKNALVEFQVDGKSPMAFASLSAEAFVQNQPAGTLSAEFSLDHALSLDQGHMTAHAELQDLSTPILEVWLAKPLTALIGPTLNLNIEINKTPAAESLKVKGSSEFLSVSSVFTYKDDHYELQTPAQLKLSLTKEGYALIDKWLGKKEGPFSLNSPTTVHFSASRLFIPKDFSWTDLLCDAKFEINNFSLRDKRSQQVTTLKNLFVTLNKSSPKDPLRFQLKGVINPGSITMDGSWTAGNTSLTANLDQFPTVLLDSAARSFGQANIPFSSLFGQTVNATLNTQIRNQSGPIDISLHSPNTRAALKGKIDQGTLTLTQPLHAQILMSKELIQWLIEDVKPLSISSIYANNPLTLEISPEGFSMPLTPFDMSHFAIGKGRVELGQVTCHNDGNLSLTLGLLKSKQLTREKELKLWFAPIDFSIKDGVAFIERTEILVAETFDIALWGKMDFVKDKVNMVLGLTPQTLKEAFGIKNLPEHYMLQIPMKGSPGNVQINTGKATAKIAALLAWQQKDIAGGIFGGPAGAIVGELLNNLGALPDKDSKSPAAKHPFPWEGDKPHSVEKKTGALMGDEKPLKQLLKILR